MLTTGHLEVVSESSGDRDGSGCHSSQPPSLPGDRTSGLYQVEGVGKSTELVITAQEGR